MLKELCRHITYARELARQIVKVRAEIQAFMEGSAADTAGSGVAERRKIQAGLRDELCRLLRSHGYQTERIGNLSTKLRLTKQSRYDASSAYRAAKDAGSTMKKPLAGEKPKRSPAIAISQRSRIGRAMKAPRAR